VLDVIHDFLTDTSLDAEIIVNPTVYGPLVNPWEAVEWAFRHNQADFVVYAEDDVVVSEDVLEYFDWASVVYADARVGAVCSWSQSEPDPALADVVETGGDGFFSAHVWGTWPDRWYAVMRDTWDKDYSSGGAMDSGWDWHINRRVFPAAGLQCVRPQQSRSNNIGEWGGAHQRPEDFPATVSRSFRPDRPPVVYKEASDDHATSPA
jgi:hypothetical protein